MKAFIILFLTVILVSSCRTRVVRTQPETVVVVRPAPPQPGAVWIDNEYVWRGGQYVVVPGHYVRNTRTWIPGHWRPTPRGYRWIGGHWRR